MEETTSQDLHRYFSNLVANLNREFLAIFNSPALEAVQTCKTLQPAR
jgi:hypothetical protein